jgi:hypothetical protein
MSSVTSVVILLLCFLCPQWLELLHIRGFLSAVVSQLIDN